MNALRSSFAMPGEAQHFSSSTPGDRGLGTIAAHAGVGLSELTLDGRFIAVNDELCRFVGRSREELLQKSVGDVTHPDDLPNSVAALERVIATGQVQSLDKRYLRPDGTAVWANSLLTRVDNAEGRPQSIVATTSDLTDRLRAERELRNSEERLRAFVTASTHMLYEMNSDWSEMRLHGREFMPQYEGKNRRWLEDFVPECDHARLRRAIAQAMESGSMFELEHRILRRDGSVGWTFSRAIPLHDAEGNISGWFGAATDITDRKLAEDALRVSEEKFRQVSASNMLAIGFFDGSGTLVDANAAFLEVVGCPADEMRRKAVQWTQLFPPEWSDRAAHAMSQLAIFGRIGPQELQFLRCNGERFWGLFGAARLGESDQAVAFILDISERKHAEQELRRYREELEVRVRGRTAELDLLNRALREENAERRRAENDRQQLLRLLVSAQEEERRRISRELHDQVGQHIAALMLGLKSLDTQPAVPTATLRTLQGITETIGEEIHQLALELRPTALDDLGLLRTLSNYIEQWSARTGIAVELHSSGWDGTRVAPAIETTAYRIIQEALTNVLKHARAQHVSLILERRTDQVSIIIEDDGAGFELQPSGSPLAARRLGILGMRERASAVGGEVNLESSPGAGTTVFVRLPLQNEKESLL